MNIYVTTRDERPIQSIHDDVAAVTWHIVGRKGITKILPYKEPHGEGHLTYLAIFKDEEIIERRPLAGLRINYFTD